MIAKSTFYVVTQTFFKTKHKYNTAFCAFWVTMPYLCCHIPFNFAFFSSVCCSRLNMTPRSVEILIISDVHLGTFGCHAAELLQYLQSIQPKLVVLNGDIIDIWNFKKNYFPPEHWAVIEKIFDWISKGIRVHYITGNHDEVMRRFVPLRLNSFELEDKLLLDVDGKKIWIFHGDVFDLSIKISKTLAKLGGMGYDYLIWLNRLVNKILISMGYAPRSFSKRIKDRVKRASQHIDNFETTAAELAIDNHYQYVVCGHIHKPQMREVRNEKGSVMYLNSGDWIENLSSLEYNDGAWKLYYYRPEDYDHTHVSPPSELPSYESLIQRITDLHPAIAVAAIQTGAL